MKTYRIRIVKSGKYSGSEIFNTLDQAIARGNELINTVLEVTTITGDELINGHKIQDGKHAFVLLPHLPLIF